jgi:hypothetical protein
MRTVVGLFVVGAVITQLSPGYAATEVARFPANNSFLTAVSNDPVTGTSTGVFVTRELGVRGGPVYRLFYIISQSDGTSIFGGGLLDAQDFQITPRAASLNVDVNTLTLDIQEGGVPENGVIDVEWEGTSSERISGSTIFVFDNIRALFVGTSLTVPSDITGSVFGVPLVDPFGDIRILHQGLIVITRD